MHLTSVLYSIEKDRLVQGVLVSETLASMLPRRQQSGKRMRLPHDPRPVVTARQALLGAVTIVFFMGVYFNYSFMSRTSTLDTKSRFDTNGKRPHTKDTTNQLSSTLDFETRAVQHIVFTSSCSEIDIVHSEVLAHSARATGYKRNITHLAYGCTNTEFEQLKARKNPKHRVLTLAYPEFFAEPFVPVKDTALAPNWFGAGVLATTIHPLVVQEWFTQHIEKSSLKQDEFIMLVDNDGIFTKNVDVWNLYREVDDIVDPRWFGQDGAWYIPKQFPLTKEELALIVPSSDTKKMSLALTLDDWRPYATTGPYVAEVGVLQTILPSVAHIWSRLRANQRHLAIPIAAAHHELPIGISGVLTVHHYPSRYENWDFADDVHTNPCNETVTSKDIELASFPITLRANNFTLPQWIDGRMWSFFDSQIPRDFLTCDGWLLAEPNGQLWHLASTTQGYERVPTILRRRNTISVCLALHAYNQAAIDYKTQFCPMGFNRNKKIPMEFKGKTWSSALALAADTSMDDKSVVLYGEYQTKADLADALAVRPGQIESDSIRFVFVTSCTPSDQWHSDVLAHSFAQVGQRGRLTRIVSGCTDQALKQVLKRTGFYPHLDLFATKSFAVKPSEDVTSADSYTPFNRPFGLREWHRHANPPIYEDIVVLLTSDFIFMRPVAVNSGFRVTRAKDVDSENYKEHAEVILGLRQYKRFFVYEGTQDVGSVTDTVKNGVAIAQRWTSFMGAAGFENAATTAENLKVCSSCRMTEKDAREYYSVGPPYIMTKHDLSLILDDYCSMAVAKRELNRHVDIAEMVGLVLASAKQKIRYTTFDNLALGGYNDEYGGFIKLIKENPCADRVKPSILAEAPSLMQASYVYEAVDSHGTKWTYDHSLVPENIFACDVWMLAVPPASVWDEAKDSRDIKRMQQAYGVCTSIKLLNQAIMGQRQRACPNGFNENRKLRLVRPRPAAELKIGQVDRAWETAASIITEEIHM